MVQQVFGVKNDFFAEMLFCYISEHAPLTHVINFHQFFKRLFVFFPKKDDENDGSNTDDRIWKARENL